MLESPGLWIEPSVQGTGPWRRFGIRVVRDAAGGRILGRIAVKATSWLPFSVRMFISVMEGIDGSAVFCARRAGWLPGNWDICDSDDRLVAGIRGSYLLTDEGVVVAMNAGSAVNGRILDDDRTELGAWRDDGDGLLIQFRDASRDEPFLRMAIVTAALTSN